MRTAEDRLECLVIGGGPAGLVAATYLARFRRRFALLDSGRSRARWIPTTHNCPGFPFGVAGPHLLARLRAQAEAYGATITPGTIVRLERQGEDQGESQDGHFLATASDGRTWRARLVILATGIVDRMPDLPQIESAIASQVVRLCAICDGYEASDEDIAVFGPVDRAIGHALFLRTFSRRVTVVPADEAEASVETASAAREGNVKVLAPALRMESADGGGCAVTLGDGSTRRFDTIYPVLGSDAQSQLAQGLGATQDAAGELIVDAHLQTSVDGLYAIGDIASSLNQISVAVGHAAIAATAVHRRLPHNFCEDSGG